MMNIVDTRAEANLIRLMQTHQHNVWRYLRMLGCEAAEADDLTQDTFLVVLRRPFDERGAGQTAAYLRMVARNLYLMRLRHEKRKQQLGPIEDAEEIWEEDISGDNSDEWLAALEHCLSALDGKQRQTIDLFYRDKLGREEIATQMSTTATAVKALLQRTREMLRECVQRKMDANRD